MFKEYFEKRKIKKEFLKEHRQYMPNYSKKGQKLNWRIIVYKDGDYNVFTGEQSGEWKVMVRQKSPYPMIDNRVYSYNPKTKTVEVEQVLVWGY